MTNSIGRGPARIALAVMMGLGLWLHAPSLHFPFSVDDMLHVAELEGHEPLPGRGARELYVFADGEPDPMGPVQGSYLPWWSHQDLRVAFHRPLSSLTHGLDHALYGADPMGFHGTNLVLWALVLLAVWLLYADLARDSGRGVGALLMAGAIFALDSAHVDNVTWIAGRYTLVTVFFSALALRAYHRHRRAGSRSHLFWALGWLVAALFSSEAAVAVAFWIAAYELCVSRSPLRERARAMVPFAVVILGYLLYYKATGHGTQASAMYADPLADPARFLQHMARVAPISARTVLTSAEINLVLLKSGAASWAVPLAIALVLAPQLWRDRLSAFALLGALLGLIPQSASSVREYALLLPSVGVAWVYGAFVSDLGRDVARWLRGRSWPGTLAAAGVVIRGGLAVAIVFVSLWLDPSKAAREVLPERRAIAERRVELAEDAELPSDDAAADARILLLTNPDPSMAIYLPIYRLVAGHPWPGGIWPISISTAPHRLTRTGSDRFSLSVQSRTGFVHGGFVGMFNDARDHAEGERFGMGVLQVEVLETFQRGSDPDRRVKTIEVTLDRRLDDPSVWLLAWDGERYTRLRPPRIGGQRVIARQPFGLRAPNADASGAP